MFLLLLEYALRGAHSLFQAGGVESEIDLYSKKQLSGAVMCREYARGPKEKTNVVL